MTDSLRWRDGEDGRLADARFVASPNADQRPVSQTISLLVVHAISLPPGEFGGDSIETFFTNSLNHDAHPYYREIAGLHVSAHFLIRRDGEVIQFVPCALRAWHAGVSTWLGQKRCNDFSIGVEIEGCDEKPFEAAQYRTLNQLTGALIRRYPIKALAGHSDIAPGRKCDPGACFDWSLVAAQ